MLDVLFEALFVWNLANDADVVFLVLSLEGVLFVGCCLVIEERDAHVLVVTLLVVAAVFFSVEVGAHYIIIVFFVI